MTKDEALKMAQDLCPYFHEISKGAFYDGFITALDQLPDTTKMIEPIIAGAVYDFAGFITTRNKVIRVGATADAAPVADLVKEWANRRSLSLENAAVGSWEKALAEPEMLRDRGVWSEFGNSGMQYPEECDLIGGETDCVEEPPNSTTDVVEPEPVAWFTEDYETDKSATTYNAETAKRWLDKGWPVTPLYTAPPKREWQGLTGEEIAEGQRNSWVDKQAFESAVWWAEEKLKEKNRG